MLSESFDDEEQKSWDIIYFKNEPKRDVSWYFHDEKIKVSVKTSTFHFLNSNLEYNGLFTKLLDVLAKREETSYVEDMHNFSDIVGDFVSYSNTLDNDFLKNRFTQDFCYLIFKDNDENYKIIVSIYNDNYFITKPVVFDISDYDAFMGDFERVYHVYDSKANEYISIYDRDSLDKISIDDKGDLLK